MAVCPCGAMCAELVTRSGRAWVTLSRRWETDVPMDWIWPALCDWVCAMERRSRRSSVSWDSRVELFFWDWKICAASQRISAAKRMATMSKAEFMDYYFTRPEKNSPPRVREEKDLTQRARRLDHRAHREEGLTTVA